MDAIAYLKSEHQRFRQVLEEISQVSEMEAKKTKFDTLCKDLTRHEIMEEKIWYSFLRKYDDLNDIINHLIDEEKSAIEAMEKFSKTSFDFMWKLRFAKFRHDVDHHATEEEEELFPKVEQLIAQEERDTLGGEMREFKYVR